MQRAWFPIVVLSLVTPLAADDTDASADVIKQAATALGNGDAAAFLQNFDPAIPAFKTLRTQATALLKQADAQSTIQFLGNTGDDRARILKVDWNLNLSQRGGSKAVVVRHVQATCRVETRGGQWRITRFEPAGLFAPLEVEGAWNLLEAAAASLTNGNAGGFLSSFSPSMPGYEELRQGAAALVAAGEVQSSIELIDNQGTDESRTLQVDWTLRIIAEDTNVQKGIRNQRVTCRVELQGKRWRIMQVEPAGFFSAALLGLDVPDHRHHGGTLGD
jgi:hypothetical protein